MACPYCKSDKAFLKRGFYRRPSDQKRLRRWRCRDCQKSFSEQIFGIEYRLQKRSLNQFVFRALCKGVSQRGCAFLFNVHRDLIARRVVRFGACARHNLEVYRSSREAASTILIDEMESFEHTKCKPLTLPIAVEEGTRKILSLRVGKIAAKGHLAAISRKKYGFRRCERQQCLRAVLSEIKQVLRAGGVLKSDESRHYPEPIKRLLPGVLHKAYKGRRGCIVGQGELKVGGFDPLFSLNHSYAMIRDNIKRLSRRTWATTKRPDRLELLVNLYAWFHNLRLDKPKGLVQLHWI